MCKSVTNIYRSCGCLPQDQYVAIKWGNVVLEQPLNWTGYADYIFQGCACPFTRISEKKTIYSWSRPLYCSGTDTKLCLVDKLMEKLSKNVKVYYAFQVPGN